MPTPTSLAGRHAVVDRRPGQYLSFPDLWRSPADEVLCAYREADEHVPNRRRLLVSRSTDGGRTWSPPEELDPRQGHCPRFAEPEPGTLVIIDDAGRFIRRSEDGGRTWDTGRHSGMEGFGIPDRILALPDGVWLTTAHRHEGEVNPIAGQKPATQAVFHSRDAGRSWERVGAIGGDHNLVLCEASITPLPDGRLLALARENSQVGEPMYRSFSTDAGRTWSEPEPALVMGHRPTAGLTRDGRLLVTYRDRGPAGGTAAWLGEVDDLAGFAVHSSIQHGPEPEISPAGLVLQAGEAPTLYALRPVTDPTTARGFLEARLAPGGEGALLRLGLAWKIAGDALTPILPAEDEDGAEDVPRDTRIPLPRDRENTIRLAYDAGRLDILVNGEHRAGFDLPAAHVRRRPVLFGTAPHAAGTAGWLAVRQLIVEPSGQKTYAWDWSPALGQPDARVREEVLQLAADPQAAWCDYGYSGWVETGEGRYLCAYHHGGGDEDGYEPGKSAHVRATRFTDEDFR